MLVKVAISAAIGFEGEANRESADRLSSQVGDRGSRVEHYGRATLPDATAEVRLLEVIEEALVETTESFKQLASNHDATSRLEPDRPIVVPTPVVIDIRLEHLR